MNFKKAPGIEDVFPDRMPLWNTITQTARNVFHTYNFREIILPVMEFTELFQRGIGDETDIVSKEMFTFEDRGGRSLTLRPEGTASVVRAYCENGDYNRLSRCKLYYCGPMFRAEKPQRGRLRQFTQFGAELFGEDIPEHDFEMISMVNTITKNLGINEYTILLNSIGCSEDRAKYIADLKKYYEEHKDKLCKSCLQRLEKNPLRLLDCKEESCSALKSDAPKITEYLCEPCSTHHRKVCSLLDAAAIAYTSDPYLVRGLDYYSKTTFEFVTTALGGQNAFAAGGRYNRLVEELGGKPTPAVGFAAGVERIYLMMEESFQAKEQIDCYIINLGRGNGDEAVSLIDSLRKAGISCDMEYGGGSFKSQMKKCVRENAKYALIIDDSSRNENAVKLKNIENNEETEICFDNIQERLYTVFNKTPK